MKEVGYAAAGYQANAVGKDACGTAVSRRSRSKKSRKKALNYNYREVSGMVMRAKRMQSASAALSMAKGKLGNLKRCAASGQYDKAEVSRAVTHASRMVQCAQLKVRNMKQEEQERRKSDRDSSAKKQQRKNEHRRHVEQKKEQELRKAAARQLAQLQSKKREVEEMDRRRRSHRTEENGKVLEADMKYLRSAIGRDGSDGASAAAVLELGGAIVVNEQWIEQQVESGMGGDGLSGGSFDAVSADITASAGMPPVDVGGANVDVAL